MTSYDTLISSWVVSPCCCFICKWLWIHYVMLVFINKSLNFLDINITNPIINKYLFKKHSNEAITNIHIKPTSFINTNSIKSVFKGFLQRVYLICLGNILKKKKNWDKIVGIKSHWDKIPNKFSVKNISQNYYQVVNQAYTS